MATISDVARQAGVSVGTVSRFLNDAPNLAPETREKIQLAVTELGYVPNSAARTLRSKRSYALALVVPDITNFFWPTVARGVEDAAQRCGYSVLLCNTDEDPAKQARYLNLLASQRVDGVIIAPHDSDPQHLALLRDRRIPTVLIDRRVEGWDVDAVYCDLFSAAKAVVGHLLAMGHRQIAAISGPRDTTSAEDRVAGYVAALTEAGLTVDPRLIRRGEYRAVSGEQMTHKLLDEGLAPTAIFAANSALAKGVLLALRSRRLRVPNDIALACFGDSPDPSSDFSFLTTAVQPAYEMGANAAQLLLSRLEMGDYIRPRRVVLPVRLMIRRSSVLATQGEAELPLNLLLREFAQEQSILVHPTDVASRTPRPTAETRSTDEPPAAPSVAQGKTAGGRLLAALRFEPTDRPPFLALKLPQRAICEYVLGREVKRDDRGDGQSLSPEQHMELARRLGLDAVPCYLGGQPEAAGAAGSPGAPSIWLNGGNTDAAPSVAEHLSQVERYLWAAQGTSIGVIAVLAGCCGDVIGAIADGVRSPASDQIRHMARRLDRALEYQERLAWAICNRFGADLACVLLEDRIADRTGLLLEQEAFEALLVPRLRRLAAPAQQHGCLFALSTPGKLKGSLASLAGAGIAAVHTDETALDALAELKAEWAGKIALIAGIADELLVNGTPDEVAAMTQMHLRTLAPNSGYVLCPPAGAGERIAPVNFMALARTIVKDLSL